MTKLNQMSLENNGGAEKEGVKPCRIHLREISGDSESPLETVGQDLRAARLRRGDEIASVSRALKIRKDYLEALENDRLEDLPGKTYAIGFVRSYSRHLGLDSAAFVERFKQDISGRAEEQAQEPAPIHQEEGRRLPQGWRIIAGVVLVLFCYGVWHLFSPSGESSQTVPPAPMLSAPKPKPVPPPQPMVFPAQTAMPSPAADNSAPGAPAAQVATATPSPATGPQSPATRISAPAQNAAIPAVPGGQAATAQTYGAQNVRPRVVLRARGDVRLTVKGSDGQLYLNRDLKPGDVYQVPNIAGLSFATSNGGVVEVDLDGIALGRASQPGQVLGKVSLDPASLVDRFNSR